MANTAHSALSGTQLWAEPESILKVSTFCFLGSGRLLSRYIEDCAAFKWGLISSGELLPMVRAQRDSFLLQTPLQLIEDAIVAMPSSHPLALTLALQTIADIDALSAALQALDDHTHLVVR